MDFRQTRAENDQNLLGRIEAIRESQDLHVLEPFARAYLGLFYDIDKQVAPAERIDLLANSELSAAIKQGLVRLLYRPDLPAVEDFARAYLKQENLGIGYAILAGIALYSTERMPSDFDLPEQTLKLAICSHHLISTFHPNLWYKPLLLARPQQSAQALLAMWQVLIDGKQDFLPGLRPIIDEQDLASLRPYVIVPLLTMWRQCRYRDLFRLLKLAFFHADKAALREVTANMLERSMLMNLRNQVYWQTTAFLLSPEEQGQRMLDFMGQEKMKLLPMLDFVMPLLDNRHGESFRLSATGYGYLIRCLAKKFTPQVDVYDNLGEITLKVLWLFYQLACFSAAEGAQALQDLRKVRVLKLYSDIFDAVGQYQLQTDKPDFAAFVQALRDEGRLRMKKNRHDVR